MEEGLPEVPALSLVRGSSWQGKKEQEAGPGERVRAAALTVAGELKGQVGGESQGERGFSAQAEHNLQQLFFGSHSLNFLL